MNLADGGLVDGLVGFEVGDQVSNPLYAVIPEHLPVLALIIGFPLLVWIGATFLRRRAKEGDQASLTLLTRYRVLPTARRWAVMALLASAVIHLLLVFSHEPSGYTVLYLVASAALAMAARWVVYAILPKLTVLVLVGSIVGFWFLGAPPDQVGIATKLIEMFTLALLVVPRHGVQRRMGPAGVVGLVVFTGLAVWIGAFVSAGEDGGHHGGEFPDPGTVVPYIDRLEATYEEERAADELYSQVVAALEKYEDPAVAADDGYEIGVIVGRDHHADNPAYLNDGRVLDPERPETLVYAQTEEGPVLLGAMFQMPGLNNPGPRVGGPLTVWHSHENVCLSLTPSALVGLMSPYGSCPAGSFNIPWTNEMIHAWTIDRAEDGWGHHDDEWLDERLG